MFAVVALRVVEQAVVEGARVVEQQVFVVVDELFLHGAVEAFGVGVDFRASWIGVAVSPALRGGVWMEGAGELVAVVGRRLSDGAWQGGLRQRGEACGVGAVGARHGECEGEAGGVVGGGEQAAAGGVDEARDGVEGDALADFSYAQVAPKARAV